MNKLFEALILRAIWDKGHPIPGEDRAVWRRDDFGNTIKFEEHGNRYSNYGWEKDHIVPQATGGSNDVANLRPLHWRKNAGLGGVLGGLLR